MKLSIAIILTLLATTFNGYSSLANETSTDKVGEDKVAITTELQTVPDVDFRRPPPHPIAHPYPIHGGGHTWHHWNHPVFARPTFNWNWRIMRSVTCTAQNSSGYQFPVTEGGFFGIGYQGRMEQTEDAAIDRCFAETNGDQSCVLLGCTPGY